MNPEELGTDKGFMAANPTDQRNYLMSVDADFAKASPDDQNAYLQHIRNLQEPVPGSAVQRFSKGYTQGAGVMSDEDAKNFFKHPIDTAEGIIKSQRNIGNLAYKELGEGNYKQGAADLIYSAIPVIGPSMSRAGHQLSEGDIAGGVGATLGIGTGVALGAAGEGLIPEKPGAIPKFQAEALKKPSNTIGEFTEPAAALRELPATGAKSASDTGEALNGVPKMRWNTPSFEQVPTPESEALQTVRTPAAAREPQAAALSKVGTKKAEVSIPKAVPIYRDATRQNVPFAGEEMRLPGQKVPESALPKMEHTPAARSNVPEPQKPHSVAATESTEGETWRTPADTNADHPMRYEGKAPNEQRSLVKRAGARASTDDSPEGLENKQRFLNVTNQQLANYANEQKIPKNAKGDTWEASDFTKTGTDYLPRNKEKVFNYIMDKVDHNQFMQDTRHWGRGNPSSLQEFLDKERMPGTAH